MATNKSGLPSLTGKLWSEIPIDDPKMGRLCKDKFEQMLNVYQVLHNQWNLNLALYKGTHFLERVNNSVMNSKTNATSQRRLMENYIGMIIRQLHNKVIRFQPNVTILNESDSWKDKKSAKAAESIVKHIWREFEIDKTNSDVALSSEIFGGSWLKIGWNPDTGPENAEGDKIGDLEYQVIAPHEIFIDPGLTSMDDMKWFLHARLVDVGELRAMYPDHADEIQADSVYQKYNYFSRPDYEQQSAQALVIDLWHKRTIAMPKGRHTVVINDKLIQDGDNPFDHGQIPFLYLPANVVPLNLHGQSVIVNLRPLQIELNKTISHISENQNFMGRPKWWVQRGSKIINAGLTNGITTIESDIKPEPIVFNPTPPEVFEFKKDLEEQMGRIAGVSSQTQGVPPPGIKSGIALQYLGEYEEQGHMEKQKRYQRFIRDEALMTLQVIKQFYKKEDGRIIKIVGKNNEVEAEKFDETNLVDNYTIVVQNASALPETKAARLDYVLQLAQMGLVTDTKILLDMMDLPDIQGMMSMELVDLRTAEQENDTLENAKSNEDLPHASKWEDQVQHLKAHGYVMKSARFKKFPEEIQARYEVHAQEHKLLMDQEQAEQMQLQMAQMPPPPAPTGAPTGPMLPPGMPPVGPQGSGGQQ